MILHRGSRLAILMVSHNLGSLRHHVERVFLIKNHRVAIGSCRELLDPSRIIENRAATL